MVSDPSVSVGGGDVNTAIDHVYGVSGGSKITSQSGLTIESRITPYPSFNNTNNLTLRSPLIHSAE